MKTEVEAIAALRGRELYELGREQYAARNWDAAFESFARSAEITPHFKALELAGECLLELRRYGLAVLYLAASAGLARKQWRCRLLLAKALAYLGRHEGALEVLDECESLNPKYRAAAKLREEIRASRDSITR